MEIGENFTYCDTFNYLTLSRPTILSGRGKGGASISYQGYQNFKLYTKGYQKFKLHSKWILITPLQSFIMMQNHHCTI